MSRHLRAAVAAGAILFAINMVFGFPWSGESRTEVQLPPSVVAVKKEAPAESPKILLRNVTMWENGTVVIDGNIYYSPKHKSEWATLLHPSEVEYWVFVLLVTACVVSAALAAGLTMGLVSVDALKLHVTLEADVEESDDELIKERLRLRTLQSRLDQLDDPAGHKEVEEEIRRVTVRLEELEEHKEMREEKSYARRILPVVEQHHLLLVTLLLTNAVANECMPIFLDQLVPSWLAVLLSVTFVLVFGEIVPSAIFTGKHQMKIAAFFTPMVQALMVITGPVSYPISKILDYVFGKEEHDAYSKDELKAFIRMHGHREHHEAVVILKPHPDLSLRAPQPPSPEELEEALKDAKILHMLDEEGRPDAHNARFCTTNEVEFKRWLEDLLIPSSFYPSQDWDVLMHPLSNERRDMNKPRAHIGFSSRDDAVQVCQLINRSIVADGGGAWLHGWVRVEAEVAESQHAVRMQKLAEDECAILCGVIEIGERPAGEAAHLLDERFDDRTWRIFMLSHNTILDRGVLAEVMRRGHSRIPIYQVHEFDVTLDCSTTPPHLGISLALPGATPADSEATWGHWNRIGCVEHNSPADEVGLDDSFYVCAVNGVRLKKLSDFERLVKKSTGNVVLRVYRDEAEDRRRICGMLLAKKLLVLSPEDYRMVGDVTERFPLAVAPDETLLETLSKFRQGGSHMAIVTDNPERLQECWNTYRRMRLPGPEELAAVTRRLQKGQGVGPLEERSEKSRDPLEWAHPICSGEVEILGLLTLEDVLEEFMGDIADETDARESGTIEGARRDRIRKIAAASSSVLAGRTPTPMLRTPSLPHYAHSIPHLKNLRHTTTPGGMTSRFAKVRSTSLSGKSIPPSELTPLLPRGSGGLGGSLKRNH